MKAILIDSYSRTISKVSQDNMDECYEHLNCNLVEVGGYLPNEDCVYVDEEGVYNQPKCERDLLCGFELTIPGQDYKPLLIGNGLVVGTDREGNTVACKSLNGEIEGMVRFVKIKGDM